MTMSQKAQPKSPVSLQSGLSLRPDRGRSQAERSGAKVGCDPPGELR